MNATRSLSWIAAPFLAATIGLGLTACNSSSKTATTATTAVSSSADTATTSAAPVANTTNIAIKGFSFNPSPAHAQVGETITVTNSDGTDHTLTADDGSFDTGKFSSGSKTITLTKAGNFKYHCGIHNYMTGSIQVGS